jgi:hypothetical protein
MTIALAFAMGGCEDKPADPTKDKTAEAKDAKKTEAKPEKKEEGATKPAKVDSGKVDADALSDKTTKLLEALKKKDVDALAAFVAEADREEMKKQFSEGGKAHNSFFGANEWRWKAVDGWDGKVHEVRMDGETVKVKFAEIDGKESAVVTWKKKGDEWAFDDLHSPSNEDFAKWGNKLGAAEGAAAEGGDAKDEKAAEGDEAQDAE